jgi:hypothetical protein
MRRNEIWGLIAKQHSQAMRAMAKNKRGARAPVGQIDQELTPQSLI